MKSNKLLATGVLLLSFASLAIPSLSGDASKPGDPQAHAGKWQGQEGFEGRDLKRLGETLALTDAQKETLKAQRTANKPARDALFAKISDARQALVTAVDAGANDSELHALAETLGKLHAEQALAGAKAKKAFLAVLTDEQKHTLAELKSTHQEHKRKHRPDDESAES